MIALSPDMKYARNRLEDLLSTINKEQKNTPDKKAEAVKDENDEQPNRFNRNFTTGNKRPVSFSTAAKSFNEPSKKLPRSSRKSILFELRQKPFELPNMAEDYSLYKLCRVWMRGKDDMYEYREGGSGGNCANSSSTDSLKLSHDSKSGRKMGFSILPEIHYMPPPSRLRNNVKRIPSPVLTQTMAKIDDISSKESILAAYMPHWKNVKQRWCKHSLDLQHKRYGKSWQLLQNAVISSST